MVGEHIRVLRDGRWVHAIDCGDETVLHLAEEAPPPRVRRAYRPEFVAGAASVELVTHRERTFAPKEIVSRAYSRASDPALAAMFRDSEAFVEWCTTGRLGGPRNVAIEVPPVAAPVPARPRAAAPPAATAAPRKPAKRPKARPSKGAKRPAPKARRKARPAGRAKATAGRRATKPAKATKAAKKGPRRIRAGARRR